MYLQSIARTAARLAMILLFILALAGCGDDASDMDAHVMGEHAHEDEDEHEHEGEHAEGEVIVSFRADPEHPEHGFEKGRSAHFSQSLKLSSYGRYGFVLQRSGHLGPRDPALDDNRIYIVDSGLAVEEHGDHFDPATSDPELLPYQLGHGGVEDGQEDPYHQRGLYNPVHFVSHHGLTAIFYDGINPARSDDPDAVEQKGVAVVYRDSDFEDSMAPPMPIFEYTVDYYSHGAAVPVHDELFIVTLAEPDGALPDGVATYSAHEHGDHVDVELEQSFAGRCPGLHGEATWGPYVVFSCYRGDGILVLEHVHETDSLEDTVVAYPGEYKSGGLAATTRHEDEVEHDDVIFMVRYGENQQDFVKITEHDIEDGLDAEPEVVTMEWGSTDRHRAFAFEPVEGSAGRLLIQDQDADGDNYHLDVLQLGDEEHTGKGRFVVLTATGDLHIFDLATSDRPATIPGIVGADCLGPEEDICPELALAPGFAYVSDPAKGMVHKVHLDNPDEIHSFDEGLTAPTELVVLGRFGYELEHEHARHE